MIHMLYMINVMYLVCDTCTTDDDVCVRHVLHMTHDSYILFMVYDKTYI